MTLGQGVRYVAQTCRRKKVVDKGEKMRRFSIVALLVAACCFGAAYIAMPASADESCESGYVCSWTEINFLGVKNRSLCTTGTHHLEHYKYSAKNSCANKKNFLRIQGADWQTCMNPTGQRPIPGEFNDIDVGAEGSRC
jgi:hypothetical protein